MTLLEKLKSVKVMFDEFEDKNLGYTEDQVEEVAKKLTELDHYDMAGQEAMLSNLLTEEEKSKIALAYAFFAKKKNPFSFAGFPSC